MILTEEKTYIINVTEVDTDAEFGLNKKDIMIEYTNLELLHAILVSTMPYSRLSALYRGKRKVELQSRIAMVESVLETRGDQLAKAEQIMYLDTAERSAICHYLGIIYTRLIAQKLYGIDCMVPLNLIGQPGEKKFVKYNGAYRQDLIGYGKQNAWSVWEPVGRSENSQAAFGNGCRAASEIEKINENPLAKSAACMTYYERGYLNAVVKEPERTGDGTLWFPEENYFKAYYQPLFELFADEQPGELYGSSGGFELELTLPWTEEGKRGFRHLQIGTDQVTLELMREGISLYKEIRDDVKKGVPVFPLGFTDTRDDVLAYAIKAEGKSYLAVFTPKTDKAEIPLAKAGITGVDVKVIYPSSGDCKYAVVDGKLQVTMPQVTCARLFEIK